MNMCKVGPTQTEIIIREEKSWSHTQRWQNVNFFLCAGVNLFSANPIFIDESYLCEKKFPGIRFNYYDLIVRNVFRFARQKKLIVHGVNKSLIEGTYSTEKFGSLFVKFVSSWDIYSFWKRTKICKGFVAKSLNVLFSCLTTLNQSRHCKIEFGKDRDKLHNKTQQSKKVNVLVINMSGLVRNYGKSVFLEFLMKI